MIVQGNARPELFNPNHPPGGILIASGELSRYPAFPDSLVNLLRPKGTTIHWNCGLNVAANFNQGVRQALEAGAEWVWILGDDHEFEPDCLLRLLEREAAVLVPLVVRRQAPFIPVLFREPQPETPWGQFPPYHWHELPQHGLFEVYTCGSAGMLIRKPVLEAVGDPWFETGKMGSDRTNEDTYFGMKVHEAGFKIFADMDVQMDHWTPMSLRPVRTQAEEWTVAVNLGATVQAILPPKSLFTLPHVPELAENTKEKWARTHQPSHKE